jgi:protein-S-isoprenylcysteine O-methyltransferase Ste14
VRNPVFTAMITAVAGLTGAVPSWLLAFTCVVAGVQLQVRTIEEPYLAAAHGDAYHAYTTRVGRFLPRIGRTTARAAV